MKPALAAIFGPNRLSWRRVFAFCVGTGLLLHGDIASDQWLILAGMFLGGEAAEKTVAAWKGTGASEAR